MMVVICGLVEIAVVDICWLKAYHAHYGDDSELGMYFAKMNHLFVFI